MVSIIQLTTLICHYIIVSLGQENGMTYSNVAKLNGESYDLRANYQSKITEVFQEPSE